ncbi:ABC transporter permease [Oerskovia flava]|uniref:ABC transporter permease n=1 Tax=Oerskovia flava TaxID=2986422 RepID=UPI0022402060|nr:ABC transporter permease [Oerskovia sp. JB1-3-2]
MRLGTGHLARRQLGAHRAVSSAVAAIVLVVACVLAAAPRALTAVQTDQVAYQLSATTPLQRDLIAVQQGVPATGPAGPGARTGLPADVDATWGAYVDGLEELRRAQPEPLRSAMGQALFSQVSEEVGLEQVPGNDVRFPSAVVKLDVYLRDHVQLTEGAWPGPVTPVDPDEISGATDPTVQVVDVVTSAEAAEVLGWAVGDEITLGPVLAARLTGTYTPLDPDDPYWQHNPYSAAPGVEDDLNMGRSAVTTIYPDPATITKIGTFLGGTTRTVYPLSGAEVTGDQVPALLAQLRGFTATGHPVGPDGAATTVRMATELTAVLEHLRSQQATTNAVVAVVAAGPLGVAVAVLALGARLVVARRRSSLALLSARGASGLQLRALMALDGLALGVPAAVAGTAIGVALTPGPVALGPVVPALLAGLAPAALMALATSARGLRAERSDLGRVGGRYRWMVEVGVCVLAALSVGLLLQRGAPATTGETAGTSVDPLLAAAPLLLALAACVVALRVYPVPVRALEALFRRRRGVVPFLGAARAVRDPAGGLVPALALVVGVSVAAFSTVMFSTVRGAVEQEAWSQVGADLRVTGPILDDDVAARIAAIDGVEEVARVAEAGEHLLRQSVSGQRVTLFAVDVAALGRVQDGAPGAWEPPAGLVTAEAGALPVALASSLGIPPGADGVRLIGDESVDVDVVGTTASVLGVRTPREFVVADRALTEEALGVVRPRTALVALEPGADLAAVSAAVGEIVPTAAQSSPAELSAAILESPVSTGLDRLFVAAIVLAGLLCAVAVVMTQMIGAPARAQLMAVLRTLGFTRRQAQRLVAWELGPWALVALAVGAGLGVAVPAVVLATVDLTTFTGGAAQPAIAVDPVLLAAVAGGFALVVVAAVAISTALSRRTDLAAQLRGGDER